MLTILLIVLILLFLVSLFFRPFGMGYYSYTPSLILFIVVLLVVLFLLRVL